MPTHKLAGQTQPTTDTTQAVHAGEARFRAHHSLTVPIVQSAVYTFASTADLVAYTEDRLFWEAPEREEYGRYGNPPVRALEAKIAELEGAQDAIVVGSGMSAVTATLLLLLQPGQHFLLTDQCYPSTLEFSQKFLRRYGIDCTLVPFGDDQALTAAIRPQPRLISPEPPTNPLMRCLDLDLLVAIARRHQLLTVVDATFATPYNQRPLHFGVDLVLHSLTKYLGGHNDLMGGSVAGRFDLTTPLRQMQHLFGCLVAPQTAYLTLRGIKTLPLRVERQNQSGLAVARFLEQHPKVRRVWYPLLESHPDYAVASATLRGGGGVVSFEVDGDGARAHRLIDALRIPTIGPSLGGVESMVSPLAVMGYAMTPPEERLALGIRDELVRLCLGIEETDALLADLAQALDQI